MNEHICDVGKILDELGLTVAAIQWKKILDNPDFGNYSAHQLLCEVLSPEYEEMINRRYEINLKFSRLKNRGARIECLKTGNGRKYNDETVQQVLSFRFVANGQNVGVYGITGAGKSYFLSALCNEACRQNYRCQIHDYCDLMDELLYLSNCDFKRYTKRLKYYSRLRILFIDDFCISRYTEEGINILYHLIKTRDDLKYPTVFNSQYAPNDWGSQLGSDPNCYGKVDGIRRRLTNGYTIEIIKQ